MFYSMIKPPARRRQEGENAGGRPKPDPPDRVAAPRGEAQLLAGAKVLEDILGVRSSTPIDPRQPK